MLVCAKSCLDQLDHHCGKRGAVDRLKSGERRVSTTSSTGTSATGSTSSGRLRLLAELLNGRAVIEKALEQVVLESA